MNNLQGNEKDLFIWNRIFYLLNERYNSEVLENLGNTENWAHFGKCKECYFDSEKHESSTRRMRRIYFNLKNSSIQYKEFNSIQMQIIQSNSVLYNLIEW